MSRSKMVQGKAEASPPPSGQVPSENLARRDAKRLASELSNYYTEHAPALRQNLVTLDIIDFLQPSATLS